MSPAGPKRETFFEGILQRENHEYEVKLPIFYYDSLSLTALHTADTGRMKAFLPSSGLAPVEIAPGRCLAAVSAFSYRATDIGPYNEFSVAALVSYGKKGVPLLTAAGQLLRNKLHVYILSLPVDSEVARRGGVELAGYPKFLADFTWTEDERSLCCQVSSNGKALARLRGRKLATSQGRMLHTIIYTELNGCLQNANLYIDPQRFAQSFDRQSAALETGTGHALCDLMKDLRLSARPLAYQFSPLSRSILFNSKNVIDV